MESYKKQRTGVVINTNSNELRKSKSKKRRKVADMKRMADLESMVADLQERILKLEGDR